MGGRLTFFRVWGGLSFGVVGCLIVSIQHPLHTLLNVVCFSHGVNL